MFTVMMVKKDQCDGNEAHADREVLVVEDLQTKQTLHLCQKCFLAQLRLRAKGRREANRSQPAGAEP